MLGHFLSCLLLAQMGRYGPGIQGDSLANTPLGPGGSQASYRFRAEPGGVLRGLRPFLIWSFRKNGYHGGTGGILRMEIQEDDGSPAHLPSGKVLAASAQRLYLVPASDQFFPFIAFDRKPRLVAGALYHVVCTNPHPQGQENYLSLNALFTREAGKPLQPGARDTDWALLVRNRIRPGWVPRRTPGTREGFTPILEIDYEGGASQGVGYVEVWMGAPQPIAGRACLGEVFTPDGPPRRVEGVAVRVRRLSGEGPLGVRVESAEGRPLAEGLCPHGEPAPSPTRSLGGCAWVEARLSPPLVLQPGRTYRLVLQAPPDGTFEAFPLRKGTDKGFSAATLFLDGHAEFNPGSGWQGWEQWGKPRRLDSDLQFYFKLYKRDPMSARSGLRLCIN